MPENLKDMPEEIYVMPGEVETLLKENKYHDGLYSTKYIRADLAQPASNGEDILIDALKFYAKKEHWMAQTETGDSRLLVAFGKSTGPHGWAEAHGALQAYAIRTYKEPASNGEEGRKRALEEFDRFCRFIDGLHMNGFVENDFMSKPIQKIVRAALSTPPAEQPARGDLESAVKAYLMRCDFYEGRVISKPMPTDAEINSMRKAIIGKGGAG